MTDAYEPPTEDQLVRFVTVMALGPGYTDSMLAEIAREALDGNF